MFYGERGLRLTSVPLHAEAVRDAKPTVLMLFGGVALLLVIACVNVASLFVARAATRQHETAVRLALGASPGRVFRLHAAEGCCWPRSAGSPEYGARRLPETAACTAPQR